MNKVRFNLARGKNYMKWQVKGSNGRVVYYDPEETVMFLMGAKLSNSPATAQRIYDGQNKSVCAWIQCDHIIHYRRDEVHEQWLNAYSQDDYRLRYNPRIAPYWQDVNGNNVDNHSFPVVATIGKAVFEVPERK